jgi:hypothetical protein
MTIKTDRIYVHLGASQVRRRLKGHGFGVRKVETGGTKLAVIIHTATGEHLRRLEALFHDVIEAKTEDEAVSECVRYHSHSALAQCAIQQ